MPQVAEPVHFAYEQTPNRLRWTRKQCDAIREAGVLSGRYELIDGEIISKKRQNPPHSMVVVYLVNWLHTVFGGLFVRT